MSMTVSFVAYADSHADLIAAIRAELERRQQNSLDRARGAATRRAERDLVSAAGTYGEVIRFLDALTTRPVAEMPPEVGAALGNGPSSERTGNEMDIQSRILGISSGAREVLRCLFFHGPTWDGDIPSKSGRDELCRLGLAERMDGWQWLTREGVDFSITVMLLGQEKEKWLWAETAAEQPTCVGCGETEENCSCQQFDAERK